MVSIPAILRVQFSVDLNMKLCAPLLNYSYDEGKALQALLLVP